MLDPYLMPVSGEPGHAIGANCNPAFAFTCFA